MRVISACLLVLVCDASCKAQDCLRWFQATPLASPPPTLQQVMTYDPLRGEVVLFDGSPGAPERSLWGYDGMTWRVRSEDGPESRYGGAMCFDRNEGRVVLFGGGFPRLGLTLGQLGDTWEWDGSTWFSQQGPINSPRPRQWHALAFDSRRELTVLFGGFGDEDTLDDTHEWDGSRWTRRVLQPRPAPRYGHGMTYDSRRDVVVLLGGESDFGAFNETWEYDGSNWSLRSQGEPIGGRAELVYDETRGVCLRSIWGSQGNATWEWDGQVWSQRQTRGPSRRVYFAMAYDSRRQRTVIFGGASSAGNPQPLGDTWEFGRYPDCDQSTGAGSLDIFDFLCFQNRYVANEPYACDCDTTTGPGACDVFDFLCFQNLFAACGG